MKIFTPLLCRLLLGLACVAAWSCSGSRKFTETGKASYYHNKFQGRKMANGDPYRKGKLTAAHKTLPFGTKVKVTNQRNGKAVTVRINDRGPFVRGRVIDVSKAAAHALGFVSSGHTKICLE